MDLFSLLILLSICCFIIPVLILHINNDQIHFSFYVFHIASAAIVYLLTRMTSQAAQEKNLTLSASEEHHAVWWLFNGIIVQFLMNGSSFISNYFPKLLSKLNLKFNFPEYFFHTMYGQMDSRYLGHPTVDMVSLVSLFILFPLSCTVYYLIKTQHNSRAPLQILTSSFQLFGSIVYIGSELFESPILKHFNHVDYNLPFSQKHLIFLFAISANIIWIVIPIYLIWSGVIELTSITALNVGNVIPISSKTFLFSPLAFDKSGSGQRQYPTSPQHFSGGTDSPPYEVHVNNYYPQLEAAGNALSAATPDLIPNSNIQQPIFDDEFDDQFQTSTPRRTRSSTGRRSRKIAAN